MATSFTISAVNYANAATGIQTFTFYYKLYSASMWILISNSASVNTDGTLGTPLVVDDLTPDQTYYIQGINNCESPAEPFVQPFQT